MSRWTAADEHWMDRALALAERAYGQTAPNPLVGAVLVAGGEVLGEGVHERAGLAHAEPQALSAAAERLTSASKAELTLYVSLEPCVHHGQTPPCVEAILGAPVRRVVAAMVDPNPQVCGRGIERLRQAGVQVDVGCRRLEAEELNHAFIARQRRGRPFLALKVALSADGCIAAAGGAPRRITGEPARLHTHRLRAGHAGLLIGVTTLQRDRPLLDRRLYHGPGRSPIRLVLDPHLRGEPEWLWPDGEPPVVFCAETAPCGRARQRREEIVPLRWEPARGFDLQELAAALAARGIWSVLVEGGGRTHERFLQAGVWDRLYVYRNPELRLEGLAWEAAPVWDGLRQGTLCRPSRLLGGDILEVFDHPASVAPAADEAGPRAADVGAEKL